MNPEQTDSVIQPSEEKRSPFGENTSRRGFLSRLVKGSIGAAVLVSPIPSGRSNEDEGLPSDILTSEDLKKNRIRINNSKETELFLRKEIFDFDLFRDAKEGKIDEVIITLVDDDSLSWNALGKLDDKFAQTLGQVISEDPDVYVRENYGDIREGGERDLENAQKSYNTALEDMKLLNEGQLHIRIEGEIKNLEDNISSKMGESAFGKKVIGNMIENQKKRLERIENGSERKNLTEKIELSLKRIEEAQELLANTATEEDAKEYFGSKSSTYGRIVKAPGGFDFNNSNRFSDRQREMGESLTELDSAWTKKVHIFISVGGELMPKPEQSFAQPDWYTHYPPSINPDAYIVDLKESKAVGSYVLRHEVSHYDDGKLLDEGITDKRALDSIAKASGRYKKNQDTGGYAFIFKNKHGITFAENARGDKKAPKSI